jgi:uncharacterized protein YjdB
MIRSAIRGEPARLRVIATGFVATCLIILSGCGGMPGPSSQQGKNTNQKLSSLAISPVNPVVAIGDNARFALTGIFSDGSKQDLTPTATWTSSNPDVASVDKSGTAVAKLPGTTVIEAVSGSVSASVTLTVPPATLMSISITPPGPSVPKGSSVQVAATAAFTDGSAKDVTSSVTWASSDPSIAGVNSLGLVMGAAPGAATITASSGVIRGAAVLTVLQPVLISLSITTPAASVAKGRTQQLTVSGTFSDGTPQDVTGKVAWAISPASVATVSPTGLVSTLAAGIATVTAISGSISATAVINVSPAVLTSLAITPPNPSVTKGKSQQLTVTGTFTDASTQNITTTVAWTVSPANVVAVSNSGILDTLANGTATVTATSGSVSGSDLVTVSAATLVSIAISPANPSLANGNTQQLTASGTYNDGSTQDITGKVLWSGAVSGILDLTSAGLVTARGPGTARVTATSGSISNSSTITVSGAALVLLSVTPVNPTLFKGKTQQLTATGTYGDGSKQDLTNKVSWSGAVPGVADLSGTGLVTAQGAGTATVTATFGSITGSDTVTVSALTLMSIAISPANVSVPKGETEQLTATGSYNDGSTQDLSSKVTWSGAVPGKVDMSAAGLITATDLGAATITATDGSISGTTAVTVSAAVPVSLAVSPASPTISVGSIQRFTAVETLSDGTQRPATKLVTWTSADTDIASITAAGIATAKAEGTVAITATYHSVTGSATLIVVPVIYNFTETGRGGVSVQTYFDKTNVAGVDAPIRVAESAEGGENLCAMVYVFSADQEMSECCGCKVTQNGLLTLSLNKDLTSNPVTGKTLTRGTVQVIASDSTNNPTCDPTSLAPTAAFTVWGTHIQPITVGELPPSPSSQSTSPPHDKFIAPQTLCQFVEELGSGQGICTCGTGN